MEIKQTYRVLILTDHTKHSSENALYDMALKLLLDSRVTFVDIASRKNIENHEFFNSVNAKLGVTRVNHFFRFDEIYNPLNKIEYTVNPQDYDIIWLRLPPPLSYEFATFLERVCPNITIINNPRSIYHTGTKAFLLNFVDVCPPMEICSNPEDITAFKSRHPIVLKPFREYGGKGIVKIENEEVWIGSNKLSYDQFITSLPDSFEYLAVKYLKNVTKGDKRIIVVNGHILGASLRLPADNSWICNVAMGGTSHYADVTEEEKKIVDSINPSLLAKGIVMYGIDTLVDDNGIRVLSEINATSIGGLPQIAKLTGKPLVEKAIALLLDYCDVQKANQYDRRTINN